MTDPKNIPDDLVVAFANALGHEYSDAAICNHTAEDLRRGIAAVWKEIFGEGYAGGFEDKEISEEMSELVEKHGWAPHMTIWADGADPDSADALFDSIADAADELAPDGVTLGVTATLNPGNRWSPKEDKGA